MVLAAAGRAGNSAGRYRRLPAKENGNILITPRIRKQQEAEASCQKKPLPGVFACLNPARRSTGPPEKRTLFFNIFPGLEANSLKMCDFIKTLHMVLFIIDERYML